MITGDEVLATTFTQTQFRRGYDEREVDDLLDDVAATLHAHEGGGSTGSMVRSDELASTRFTLTQFRRGYDDHEVDELLERAVAALRHHEGRNAVSAAPPASPARGAAPATAGVSLTADDVDRAAFDEARSRQGYDTSEVDDLLDRVAEALRLHEAGRQPHVTLRSSDVAAVQLTRTMFRSGYVAGEVDEFLRRAADSLRHHEGGRVASASWSAPQAVRVDTSRADGAPPEPLGKKVLRILRGDPR